MMDKKVHMPIREDKRGNSPPFAPLSQYDDLAAKEVEELRRSSDALSKELETMTAELSRLTEHMDADSRKERLSALHAETALHDKKILELQNELPRLSEECATLRSVLEQSGLEEEFTRISEQLESLRGQRESLAMELPVIESEIAACERFIAETETLLRDAPEAGAELERQSQLLVSKNESLERLEEMMYLVSTIEGVGGAGDAPLKERSCKYYVEVDALEDGLKRKDRQALAQALDIIERLAEEYGHAGKEINELLQLLISKFSFMQELEEKEQLVASLNSEIEELRGKVDGKASALDKLRTLNSEDKKRVAAMQKEINHYREAVAPYSDELAKGEEIIRKKEAAVAEFVSLFVQNAELDNMALTTESKIRAMKDIMGKMV